MATLWNLVVTYCLPIPLALIILMALPLPRPARKGVLIFVQRVFDLPFLAKFKLLHVMIFLMGFAVLHASRSLSMVYFNYEKTSVGGYPVGPTAELSFLSKRWRAERNLWIAGFAFAAWSFLAAFYREVSHRLHLEERLSDMEGSEFLFSEQREPSASREVSSRLWSPSPQQTPRTGHPSPVKSSQKKQQSNVTSVNADGSEKRIELTPIKEASAAAAAAAGNEKKKEK